MRQGQITVFIILGLIIFGTFLLLFNVYARESRAKFQAGADQAITDAVKNSNVDTYVELCLKKIGGKALLLLGQQGGYLYEPPLQNGTIAVNGVPNTLIGNSYVGIGIIFPPAQAGYPEEPDYPLPNTPLFQSPLLSPDKQWLGLPWGFFGQKFLPPLCDPDGPNNVTQDRILPAPCNKGFYGRNSIQWQLGKFVEQELADCVDFNALLRNTDMVAGKPNVTMTLGETNIFLNATYLVNITNKRGVNRRIDFQTFLPVRLRKIYGYADSLLLLDVFYANYSLVEYFPNNKWWDDRLTVTRDCPNCISGDETDLLTIIDRASLIDSKPFTFSTAIQNRRPALDYLHEGYADKSLTENAIGAMVDYAIPAGSLLTLLPYAVDPDENPLIYYYGKWREDYTEHFLGWSCCLRDVDSYQQCRDTLFTSCMSQPEHDTPGDWSNGIQSPPSPISTITTMLPEDIGFHTMRITVNDTSRMGDYQDIGIFVYPPRQDIPPQGFRCGWEEGTPDSLSCVCSDDEDACSKHTFEEIHSNDPCFGGVWCNKNCEVVDIKTDQNACTCSGGKFLDDGGNKNCCGQTDCLKQSGDCLSRGSVDDINPKFLCGENNNVLSCTTPRQCKSSGSSYCHPDGVWQSLQLPTPSTACPNGVSPL